jgi:glutamine---fructose-6-phosphate transaminase (isomerizing)
MLRNLGTPQAGATNLSNPTSPTASDTSRFPFLMLKEIYDQPEAIEETVRRHLDSSGKICLDRVPLSPERIQELKRVNIVASGASRHAGMCGRVMIEDLAGIPVGVDHASEYSYRKPITNGSELTVVITQSGETGDTIAAQRTAHEAGQCTLAISNVAESTIVREADGALLTYAGKELAIPATKSFTTQLTTLYLFALHLAGTRQSIREDRVKSSVAYLRVMAKELAASLDSMNAQSLEVAKHYYRDDSFLILGRAVHQPIALEAALKLKEVCYIHAEGYATGELRHGPTALVDDSTPVIVIATRDERDPASMLRYEKTVALVEELRVRSSRLIIVANEGDAWANTFSPNHVLTVAPAPELLLPLIEIIPLQLLSYHIAILNGLDVDHPRNLVKSVRQD